MSYGFSARRRQLKLVASDETPLTSSPRDEAPLEDDEEPLEGAAGPAVGYRSQDREPALGSVCGVSAPTLRPAHAARHIWVDLSADVRALLTTSSRLGLAFETALAVALEHALITSNFPVDARRLDADAARIDVCARATTYARGLQCLEPTVWCRPPTDAGQISVLVPLRLLERIEALGDRWPTIEARGLGQALAWELAAYGAGLTMTEWALRVTLSRATRQRGRAPAPGGDGS